MELVKHIRFYYSVCSNDSIVFQCDTNSPITTTLSINEIFDSNSNNSHTAPTSTNNNEKVTVNVTVANQSEHIETFQ